MCVKVPSTGSVNGLLTGKSGRKHRFDLVLFLDLAMIAEFWQYIEGNCRHWNSSESSRSLPFKGNLTCSQIEGVRNELTHWLNSKSPNKINVGKVLIHLGKFYLVLSETLKPCSEAKRVERHLMCTSVSSSRI